MKAFYSTCGRLRTLEPNPNNSGLILLNKLFGGSGIEGLCRWYAVSSWHLRGGFLSSCLDLQRTEAGPDTLNYQRKWRSLHTLLIKVELDATLRLADGLERPSRSTRNVRVGCHLRAVLELFLTGRNLLNGNLLNNAHMKFSESEHRRWLCQAGKDAIGRCYVTEV